MSRPSFRARPIDVNQSLAIIRDKLDDDQAITREVNHAHKNLDKDNEEVRSREARGEILGEGAAWKRGKKKTRAIKQQTRLGRERQWRTLLINVVFSHFPFFLFFFALQIM